MTFDMWGKILDDAMPIDDEPFALGHELDGDDLQASKNYEELAYATGGIASGEAEQTTSGELRASGRLVEGSELGREIGGEGNLG